MRKFMCFAVMLTGVCAITTPGVQADTVTFEGFATGTSVNNQGGWTVEDEFGNSATSFDEEVVDDGAGNTVWRFSNGVGSSGFSDQPYSQTTSVGAGESGSALWNDRGPDHTSPLSPPNPGGPVGSDVFRAGFDFRSATGAPQTDLSISVSPSAKQSAWRNSFLGISDDGANGFDVTFFETGIAADPFGATSNFPEIASDLSYTDWHRIDIVIEFEDGLNPDTTGNDIVTVSVDGVEVYVGTTWESFYNGSNPAGLALADQPQRQAVDSLLFRSSSTVPANLGNGFYIDNVTTNVPEPASAVLLGLGGLVLLRRRRRIA